MSLDLWIKNYEVSSAITEGICFSSLFLFGRVCWLWKASGKKAAAFRISFDPSFFQRLSKHYSIYYNSCNLYSFHSLWFLISSRERHNELSTIKWWLHWFIQGYVNIMISLTKLWLYPFSENNGWWDRF